LLVSADAEHVEMLRRGPRSWNAWREQNPTIMPNLTGLRLSASERQTGIMNGGPINLASVRVRRAYLRFATLSGANLASANLSGADLTDARLDGANLVNADFSNAALARTDLAGARLAGARLDGVNLLEARNLTQSQLDDALGDALTELPSHLTMPAFWMDGDAEPEPDMANGVEAQVCPRAYRGGRAERCRGSSVVHPLRPRRRRSNRPARVLQHVARFAHDLLFDLGL
ncbi:MAG TPA: pentapeptide repeat-containing protein, partial [Methyloceanibacter sp.]|nr:pentapeptide repeat-containing protein [Methyloceanibacter sp.]